MRHVDRVRFYAIRLGCDAARVRNVAAMADALAAHSLDLEIFDAIDAGALAEDELPRMIAEGRVAAPGADGVITDMLGRPMNYGNICCTLSHVATLERVASDCATEFAVVLEDDAVLLDGFVDELERLLGRGDVDYDLVNLHMFDAFKITLDVANQPVGQLLRVPSGYWGTQCYLVRRASALKIAAQLVPVHSPADEALSSCADALMYCVCGIDYVTTDTLPSYTRTNEKAQRIVRFATPLPN